MATGESNPPVLQLKQQLPRCWQAIALQPISDFWLIVVQVATEETVLRVTSTMTAGTI